MREATIRKGAVITIIIAILASFAYTGNARYVTGADVTTFSKEAVSYSGASQALVVSKGLTGVNEIYMGVANVKTTKVNGVSAKVAKAASWNIYDYSSAKELSIDLSTLNNGKDNIVLLKALDKNGSYSDTFAVKFNANIDKLSANVDYSSEAPSINVINKSTQAAVSVDKLDYRLYGTGWSDASSIDTKSLVRRGATVFLRVKPESYSLAGATASTAAEDVMYESKESASPLPVYVAGMLAGKETKVNVKAEGAAPAAVFNYVAGKVKLPAGTEYRFVTGTPTNPGSATAWTTDGVGTEYTIKGNAAVPSSGYMEIRKVATKLAPASRIKVFNYYVVPSPNAYAASGSKATESTDINGSYIVGPYDNKKINISYSNKLLTIVNETGLSYDFQVVKPGATLDSQGRSTKVKGTAKIGGAVSGSKIYIRSSGDSQYGLIASDYVCVGVVK